jgi:DNA gyrase subunit B
MTDADVDGSHIRTLLLTFFYRQMPELIERGHVFIAQPPLYKVKQGKDERYLKDDHELKEYLLKLALKDAELIPGENRPALSVDTLDQVARSYILAEAVIDRVGRRIDQAVLTALLKDPQISLEDEPSALASARRLAEACASEELEIEPRFDQKNEAYFLLIKRTHHGNLRQSYLDVEFLESGDYAQIRQTAEVLQGLLSAGAVVKRKERERAIDNFKQALDWLLEEVKKGVSVQRYKGLGEMNPTQLWETTMDPSSRRLLRTQIEDVIAADEIFTTLMGDLVEPRRAFIESNALGVRNLDV